MMADNQKPGLLCELHFQTVG